VLWTLAAIFIYLGLEAAIFRSGFYSAYLEPNSSTGAVEYRLRWLRHKPPSKVPEVVVVGDSRMAEGFSPPIASQQIGGKLHFTNFGVPGSGARVWYYMLRDADPERNRFAAIVIAFDEYSDQDWGEDPRNRPTDPSYVAGRLGFDDCLPFARSFPNQTLRDPIIESCFFKGTAYHSDLQDFLSDIPDRMNRAKDWRNNGGGYIEGYGGKPEDLTGLTVDEEKREIHFPKGLKDWQMNSVKNTVLPEYVPQTGALTKFRRQWLGGLLNLYKESATRFIFIQIPRAPLPRPEPPTPDRFIDSVASNPHITVVPRDTFKDLEHPEVFADGLHMNHTGQEIFSKRLAEIVSQSLR
jgi:hypothetical protein